MTVAARKKLLTAAFFVLAGVACLWCYGVYRDAAESAGRAADDLRTCRVHARCIESLRNRPNLAGAGEIESTVLARQAESAAAAAGIPPGGIQQLDPRRARRIGQTVYQEKPTQILLRNVSLRQAANFLHRLTADTPGLTASALRLASVRERQTEDVWTVEATVSYLIYSPPPHAAAGN